VKKAASGDQRTVDPNSLDVNSWPSWERECLLRYVQILQ
jgi:hypothetical protein